MHGCMTGGIVPLSGKIEVDRFATERVLNSAAVRRRMLTIITEIARPSPDRKKLTWRRCSIEEGWGVVAVAAPLPLLMLGDVVALRRVGIGGCKYRWLSGGFWVAGI